MLKKIFDSYKDIKSISKYFFLLWITHPFIDFILYRINFGIKIDFKFSLIFFPVEISYHIGKTNMIKDNDI